jgi:hypothetical protein
MKTCAQTAERILTFIRKSVVTTSTERESIEVTLTSPMQIFVAPAPGACVA